MAEITTTAIAATSLTTATLTTKGLTASLIAALGPFLAEFLEVLVGGFFGALIALGQSKPHTSTWSAVCSVIRPVLAALLFSSIGASLLSTRLGVQTEMLWLPVSGVIGMFSNRFYEWLSNWLKELGDDAVSRVKQTGGDKK